MILEIFEEGGRRCSSRFRESRIDFFVSVCVCCVWPRARRKRREKVELTFLDTCWSMHGDMWDISEVASVKSTPFSWA